MKKENISKYLYNLGAAKNYLQGRNRNGDIEKGLVDTQQRRGWDWDDLRDT